MTNGNLLDARDPIIEYLASQLIGPVGGDYETLPLNPGPAIRYISGVLYPLNTSNHENLTQIEDADNGPALVTEEAVDDPVSLSFQHMPSACGVSLYMDSGSELIVTLNSASYEKTGPGGWQRNPRIEPEIVRFTAPETSGKHREKKLVFNRTGQVDVIWRVSANASLVTVSLLNTRTAKVNPRTGRSSVDPADCLYQVSMRLTVEGGKILEYPSHESSSRDHEDQEIRLLYRKHRCFGIGHGCSANWSEQINGVAEYVEIDFLPTHTLPGTTINGDDPLPEVLRIGWLADPNTADQTLLAALDRFIDGYKTWFDRLPTAHSDIRPGLADARDRLLGRIESTITAMRTGLASLNSDGDSLEAFRLANRAMLLQMRQSLSTAEHYWRPFQLAYQLLTLSSLIEENSPDREIVDLLWVPTGGGKTEAYLMLAAFEIFRRRIKYKDRGSGTTVITRYTLRLLTNQQFQRAAILVCACEKIRQETPDRFGAVPITIGLWVGGTTSPNTYSAANQLYRDLLGQPEPQNPFPIRHCPWCSTTLVPEIQTNDHSRYGFRSTNNSFGIFCPSSDCQFHDGLPIGIVDEQLYDQPPTVLIATVDKFARLAWEPRGGIFFGNDDLVPPTLVIQDELHLITGPLGTTVGLYETAIATLMKLKNATPKVLASTATIRRPDLQVSGIFGKNVRVFPPSGLDADDSYFVKSDLTSSRNRYLGVMSSSHTPTTTLVRVAASLLQARKERELDISRVSSTALDVFWSLVIYHNSLRELGGTSKFIRDDIPAWIEEISSAEDMARTITEDDVVELTGTMQAEDIPENLKRMGIPYDKPGSVSALLCTNMFSVGVDESRLGLMLVHGQPKTTSEYIQATGRVGRGVVPGLVITNYSSQKPRDRSHYESFKRYHSALYANVEPGTVTPFSRPARERALHAALVILVRHWVGLSANASAGQFDRSDPKLGQAVLELLALVNKVDPDEFRATKTHIDRLFDEWENRAETARQDNKPLYYQGLGEGMHTLLTQFGSRSTGWATLNSMRNVDRECKLEII